MALLIVLLVMFAIAIPLAIGKNRQDARNVARGIAMAEAKKARARG